LVVTRPVQGQVISLRPKNYRLETG
jgi:hypothetical protein